MTRNVVITGMGCITATGNDVASVWDAIGRGGSGIAPITAWDVAGWSHPLAGELKNYDPKTLLTDRKLLKFISKQDVLGLNAAAQAIADSGLIAHRDGLADPEAFNYRTGVYVGSPGNKFEQQNDFLPLMAKAKDDLHYFAEHLFESVHPMWLLRILPNNVLAYIGITHGFKGPNHNMTNHVVGGVQAIIEAYHAIKSGQIDRAVVACYDHGVEPQSVTHYANSGLLSARGLRAFDEEHDGTIIADGAGAIVLEASELAHERQARVYARILGGASSCDAMGIFSIDHSAQGLATAMRNSLQNSELNTKDIGMLCLHGNGVPRSDITEALAVANVFQDRSIPATGFKWSLGHTLCGAGVIETMMTALSLQNKVVPGIANLVTKSIDCSQLAVSSDQQPTLTDTALIISRAFSGMNTCLVIGNAS